MDISSISRQISYSFNTNFLLVNFAFVKEKKGAHRSPSPLGSSIRAMFVFLNLLPNDRIKNPSSSCNTVSFQNTKITDAKDESSPIL